MNKYSFEKELVESVEVCKFLIEGLVQVMVSDGSGATLKQREIIVKSGMMVINGILQSKIIKKNS